MALNTVCYAVDEKGKTCVLSWGRSGSENKGTENPKKTQGGKN